jgi:hypothetical protein
LQLFVVKISKRPVESDFFQVLPAKRFQVDPSPRVSRDQNRHVSFVANSNQAVEDLFKPLRQIHVWTEARK